MVTETISIEDFMGGNSRSVSPPLRQTINNDVINIEGDTSNRPVETAVDLQVFDPPRGIESDLTPVEVNIFDPAVESPPTPEQQQAQALTGIKSNQDKAIKAQTALAGAQLFSNVLNAQSQYQSVSNAAKTNIFLANQAVANAKVIGAQRTQQIEQQASEAGEDSLLALAAQGIDVNAPSSRELQQDFEAVGIYNAMINEINTSRQVLGIEQQVSQFESQLENAELQRNVSIANSLLMFGAQAAPLA